ncbi:retrovirus-related pol polyprotein from transposon TNT 1-94 [Tanacetum coccineum]
MQVYWASVLSIPFGIIDDIQQLIRGFLWCNGEYKRGKSKVSWDVICLPKSEGGLGIRCLKVFNGALMATYIWNIVTKKDSLWVQWIHMYKLKDRTFWDVHPKASMSWGWRKLLQLGEVMKLFYGSSWAWPQAWLLKAPNLASIPVLVLTDKEDYMCWRDGNGNMHIFSVKLAWEVLRPRDVEVPWYRIVWFTHCIPRNAFNLWLIMRQRLKTQDMMRPWDVGQNTTVVSNTCPLCNMQMDSHEHLFFECRFSSKVWLSIRNLAGMDNIPPILEDITAWFSPMAAKCSFDCIVGKLLFAAAAYHIWIERNNRLFKNVRRSPKEIKDIIVVMIAASGMSLSCVGGSSYGLRLMCVAKLLSENERLSNEINQVKQVFKEQFDSIKKTRVRTKEQSDSLIDKLNLKSTENEDLKAQIQDKELLVYVRDTCPNAINLSAKKVVVTPKNKVKKVRFVEPLTSSINIKQVESSNTSDSNTTVLSSTGLKCSTSKCGSKPTGNKRNDRISQTPSKNMKNKVEAQPRKVNKKNSVVEPIRDVDVKHLLLNANFEPICATCKKSMFDCVHDMCLLDFVENVNSRATSAKKHKKQNIWKPMGHVFTEVGLKWKPTCRTFTIVGNSYPLTRITSANVVPPKKTTSHSVETQKPELKVYSRKPKNVKNVDIPSSSSLVMTGCPDYSLVSGLRMFRTYDREPLSAHELCVDLISGSRDTNLYTISLDDMLKTSPICLLSKASKTKSWLWHRRLSHLNFGTLNKLAKDGLAQGIPRFKFQKDHLCSACALGKSKKSSHQPKAEDSNQEKVYLLHMDLCGPMRVASINGKRYILVIVDDYSRFTWVRFLRTKDVAPEAIIKCIKNIQVRLNATVRNVRTDNGTKFVNQTLYEFYENVGISHQHLLPALLSRTTLSKGKTELL